jgi:hypothetical protein
MKLVTGAGVITGGLVLLKGPREASAYPYVGRFDENKLSIGFVV